MTTRDDDPETRKDDEADLRAAFAVVRSEDAAAAPSYEAVLAASRRIPQRRRPWLVPALTGTMAAAVVAVALVAVTRRPEPRLPSPVSIEEWTAPTDFLLETPGRELLETVPNIGKVPTVRPLDGADENGRPPKRRSVSP
jgi:hypothetical protein